MSVGGGNGDGDEKGSGGKGREGIVRIKGGNARTAREGKGKMQFHDFQPRPFVWKASRPDRVSGAEGDGGEHGRVYADSHPNEQSCSRSSREVRLSLPSCLPRAMSVRTLNGRPTLWLVDLLAR